VKRTLYRLFTGMLWLALPAIALRLWMVWGRLPARVAIHFDFTGHPNGWLSPTGVLVFFLVVLTATLITATIIAFRVTEPDLPTWTLLGFFYVIVGILYGAADGIVNYNLYGRAINVVPFLVAGFGTAFVVIVVFLGTRRGPHLPPAESVIAEEAHGSPFWAFIMVLPCVFFTTLAVLAPSRAVKLVMILPTLLLLMAVIMAGSGFRYIFTQTGLEIRTLGFRLRSIPASQIRNYAVESWSAGGGYGIRGVGNKRAYVWGKQGVRIHLWDGEVFLGHRDPQRLVRDLDAVMTFVH